MCDIWHCCLKSRLVFVARIWSRLNRKLFSRTRHTSRSFCEMPCAPLEPSLLKPGDITAGDGDVLHSSAETVGQVSHSAIVEVLFNPFFKSERQLPVLHV